MTTSGPLAKVGLPALPDWVISRSRLTERINAGVRGPLTVVTGAPGAGKTLAVASWAAEAQAGGTAPGPVAWVNVDDGDAAPEVFWHYLLEALREAGVDPPRSGSMPLRADGIDHVEVAALAATVTRHPTPVVLVLDDFRPASGSAVASGAAYLLTLTGPHLRLVVASRRDLPLPLHRYRLSGDLTEIRSEDLAFTEEETAQLLAQHGVVLGGDLVRALRERTEGWAAGLRLVAMTADRHPDPEAFVRAAISDEHAIAGYLVEEVLDAQPGPVRHLLLTTSILDQVNSDLAAELAGAEAAARFAHVVEQNAFLRPVGDGWYRYHQMFRDVLRLRLRHEQPGAKPALHLRAASWFRDHGSLVEAVRHAAAAGDWQRACRYVVEQAAVGDLIGLRQTGSPLAAALAAMPDSGTASGPEPALVSAALALARGDSATCRAALRRAGQALNAAPQEGWAAARLAEAVLRLGYARAHGVTGPARNAASDVERLLERLPRSIVAGRADLRCLAAHGRATAELWGGRLVQAVESFATAHAAAVQAGSVALRLDCLAYGALAEVLRGRWRRAAELAGQAAQLAEGQPPQTRARIAVLPVARAWIALQRCQLGEARRELDRAGQAVRGRRDLLISTVFRLAAAGLDVAEGRAERALETVRGLPGHHELPGWLARRAALTQAQAYAASGNSPASWRAALKAGGPTSPDGAVALARAQAVAGNPESALGTLRPALQETVVAGSDVRVEAWLLDAQCSYATGNPARGRRSLDRALRLGDREQVRLPFAAYGSWLRRVLRAEPGLVRQHPRLLGPLRLGTEFDTRAAASPAPDRAQAPARPLSERELEVLHHLAQMRTSEEIAGKMFVSINTVKTHLKSIYRKLAVSRRGDAVRRAQQLALLEPVVVPGQRSDEAELPSPADGFRAG